MNMPLACNPALRRDERIKAEQKHRDGTKNDKGRQIYGDFAFSRPFHRKNDALCCGTRPYVGRHNDLQASTSGIEVGVGA